MAVTKACPASRAARSAWSAATRCAGTSSETAPASASGPAVPVSAANAPTSTRPAATGAPRSVASSRAGTAHHAPALVVVGPRPRVGDDERVVDQAGERVAEECRVQHDGRVEAGDDRRHADDRFVTGDDRRLGAPAAHLAAEVGAEHDVMVVGRGRECEDLGAELDALAADAGDDHVAARVRLHERSIPPLARGPDIALVRGIRPGAFEARGDYAPVRCRADRAGGKLFERGRCTQG